MAVPPRVQIERRADSHRASAPPKLSVNTRKQNEIIADSVAHCRESAPTIAPDLRPAHKIGIDKVPRDAGFLQRSELRPSGMVRFFISSKSNDLACFGASESG